MDHQELTRRFAALGRHVLGVLLWGSHARGDATPRSDIDICLVAGDLPSADALSFAWRLADLAGGHEWDLHVFEELPQHLQAAVLEHHQVLVAADAGGLYEYLRLPRRLWQDQRHRHRITRDDAVRALSS